jgi:hypothetical protein
LKTAEENDRFCAFVQCSILGVLLNYGLGQSKMDY